MCTFRAGLICASYRSGQNAAHRRSGYLKSPGDFGFGYTGTMQFADFCGVQSRGNRSAELFAVQPRLNQSGARAVA